MVPYAGRRCVPLFPRQSGRIFRAGVRQFRLPALGGEKSGRRQGDLAKPAGDIAQTPRTYRAQQELRDGTYLPSSAVSTGFSLAPCTASGGGLDTRLDQKRMAGVSGNLFGMLHGVVAGARENLAFEAGNTIQKENWPEAIYVRAQAATPQVEDVVAAWGAAVGMTRVFVHDTCFTDWICVCSKMKLTELSGER